MSASFYDFSAKTIDGTDQSMKAYQGKVVMVVNVASQCGFTPQYTGLEQIYQTYRDRGLVILGFPCNQFGQQEPGSEEDIKQFCSLTYPVSFPLFAKVDVNGGQAHPLYLFLRSQKKGLLLDAIKWNFTKFLVDRQGRVVDRFAPTRKPEDMAKDIEELLA